MSKWTWTLAATCVVAMSTGCQIKASGALGGLLSPDKGNSANSADGNTPAGPLSVKNGNKGAKGEGGEVDKYTKWENNMKAYLSNALVGKEYRPPDAVRAYGPVMKEGIPLDIDWASFKAGHDRGEGVTTLNLGSYCGWFWVAPGLEKQKGKIKRATCKYARPSKDATFSNGHYVFYVNTSSGNMHDFHRKNFAKLVK